MRNCSLLATKESCSIRSRDSLGLLAIGMIVLAALFMDIGCSDSEGPSQDAAAAAMVQRLGAEGYEVREGLFRIFSPEECTNNRKCALNNPSTYYGVYGLPPVPGEAEIPWGAKIDERPDLRVEWRLLPGEAIVFMGKTPPPAKYFSFRSYLNYRHLPFSLPIVGNKWPLEASLGDTLNPSTIGVEGNDSYADKFDKPVVVITTADRGVDRLIRETLVTAGVSEKRINNDILPIELLRMGHGEDADILFMFFRASVLEDEEAGRAWAADPGARLFRITPMAQRDIDPFSLKPGEKRGTGTNEDYLIPALDELENAIRAAHPGARKRAVPLYGGGGYGPDCIRRGQPCFDLSDAVYYLGFRTYRLQDDPDALFVIFGVNHEMAGKAHYFNIFVTNTRTETGLAVANSGRMVGSASAYLPDHPERDRLFAYKVKRDCGGDPYCLEVPESLLPLDGTLRFYSRVYLEPGKTVGPARKELVSPQVIEVRPAR